MKIWCALALGCVPVLAVAGIRLSGQRSLEEERSESVHSDTSDQSYVFMEYSHRDRPLQYAIGIWASGEAWYVRFDNSTRIERAGVGYPAILELKSGSIPASDVAALFHLVEKRGFFAMKNSRDDADPILSEDDVLSIRISMGGKVHTVHARPPSYISKDLREVVEAIKEKTTDLQEDSISGFFLRAEELDAMRVKRLKERYRFLSLAENELDEHPDVRRSISNPGRFVHVRSMDDTDVGEYTAGESFFFISVPGGEFEIRVFLRDAKER